MKAKAGATLVEIIRGDITEMNTEAIVNAANERLILGSGVAGAIRAKGGPAIQEECKLLGGTEVGEAVVTGAGNLPAMYVIHAVGPRMGEGDEDRKLKDATINSLKRADEKEMASLAFPAISTGVFGFPMNRAAAIMLAAVKEYVEGPTGIEKIVFCLHGQEAYDVFAGEFKQVFNGAV